MKLKKIDLFDAVNIVLKSNDVVLVQGKFRGELTYGNKGLHNYYVGKYHKITRSDLMKIGFYIIRK